MALRGSLREFELAEIFQLISRDAKTGQLVLSHQDNEAFVIFSKGSVIAAGTSEQNLQTFLFRYLKTIRGYSEEEINELLYVCHGVMRQFSQELINRKYLSPNELTTLAQMGVEDLACGLFLWTMAITGLILLRASRNTWSAACHSRLTRSQWRRCAGVTNGKGYGSTFQTTRYFLLSIDRPPPRPRIPAVEFFGVCAVACRRNRQCG